MDFAFSNEIPYLLIELLPNLINSLVSFAFSMVSYIFLSLGLMQLAKRRGIRNGWLAWLPIGNSWIFGSISDQYRYVVMGQVKNRRKVLAALDVVIYVLLIPFVITFVWMMVALVQVTGGGIASPSDEMVLAAIGVPMAAMVIVTIAMLVVAVPYNVFYYLSLYDLFASTKPKTRVLFLLLSILVGYPTAFLVFACRKSDEGMPPRKQPLPPVLPQAEEAPAAPEADVQTEGE